MGVVKYMFESKEIGEDVIRKIEMDKISRLLKADRWNTKQKVALACRMLFNAGHDSGLSGQITARVKDNVYITQALGLGFDEISVSNLLTVDSDLQVIEGTGLPNPANRFHSWIYNTRPDVACILHTHAQHISALSMLGVPLEIAHTDCCAVYDDVAHLRNWPGVPLGNSEGLIISQALGEKSALLLSHHGLVTVGKDVEEAFYLALSVEKAAKLQLLALGAGKIQKIRFDLGMEAKQWLRLDARIYATFSYHARKILRDSELCLQ